MSSLSPDDKVMATIQIDIWKSGALSVSGSIAEEEWAICALQNAIDAVRSHHAKARGQLIIPAQDTGIKT
jgi:hypothetical protein